MTANRLTPEREAEIRERAPKRTAEFTEWLNKHSPLPGGDAAERAETVLEEDVPALLAELAAVRAERDEARERVAELEATSIPDEVEYGIRMPDSQDVWPRKEFRSGHWEKVLADGATLLQRVIRRGPWTETPIECPGFEDNPVAPNLCAGCGEPNDAHEEAGR